MKQNNDDNAKSEDALYLAALAFMRELSVDDELAARIGRAAAHSGRFELRIRDVLGDEPVIAVHTVMPDGSDGRLLCQLALGEDNHA
jgi:hypothetical protein